MKYERKYKVTLVYMIYTNYNNSRAYSCYNFQNLTTPFNISYIYMNTLQLSTLWKTRIDVIEVMHENSLTLT